MQTKKIRHIGGTKPDIPNQLECTAILGIILFPDKNVACFFHEIALHNEFCISGQTHITTHNEAPDNLSLKYIRNVIGINIYSYDTTCWFQMHLLRDVACYGVGLAVTKRKSYSDIVIINHSVYRASFSGT